MYEILSGNMIFDGLTAFQKMNIVSRGGRPKFIESFSKVYSNLIEKCWTQNSAKRPTFEQIIDTLHHSQYSIRNIKHDDVNTYVNFIKESQTVYEEKKEILPIEKCVKNTNIEKVDLH